jgi:folate-dependent tRNA-U54 methylase TrmFO/GidA
MNPTVLTQSREEYEKTPGTNWSKLKKLKRSPAHFRHSLTAEEQEDTDALLLGRAIHLATFEPEVYASTCAVWEGGARRGKEWDAFCKANAGKELLTETQAKTARAVANAVRNDRVASRYVTGGLAEATVVWRHVEEALGAIPGIDEACKGRLDFITQDALVDLKSMTDASPDAVAKSCWNFSYHGQAAFYADGYAAATGRQLPFVMVAVETKEPHIVQVYRLPEYVLDAGRQEYRALLRRLIECRKESRWPGYAEGELELSLPRWALSHDNLDGLDLKFG